MSGWEVYCGDEDGEVPNVNFNGKMFRIVKLGRIFMEGTGEIVFTQYSDAAAASVSVLSEYCVTGHGKPVSFVEVSLVKGEYVRVYVITELCKFRSAAVEVTDVAMYYGQVTSDV